MGISLSLQITHMEPWKSSCFILPCTYDQSAISFNSENITLSVAKERYIYAKMDPPPSENFISRVKVIGYKLQQ